MEHYFWQIMAGLGSVVIVVATILIRILFPEFVKSLFFRKPKDGNGGGNANGKHVLVKDCQALMNMMATKHDFDRLEDRLFSTLQANHQDVKSDVRDAVVRMDTFIETVKLLKG